MSSHDEGETGSEDEALSKYLPKQKNATEVWTKSEPESHGETDQDPDTDMDIKRFHAPITGRGITLAMLMQDGFMDPGEKVMTIDYLGRNFVADLLEDGRIKENENIFNSPSAWAIHCKKIVNPAKKSGCGWASVKYKGRKLDSFKSTWFRNQKSGMSPATNSHSSESDIKELDKKELLDDDVEQDGPLNLTIYATQNATDRRNCVKYSTLGKRSSLHDPNTLVESMTFSSHGKIQPFTIGITTNCLLLMDCHSHLTTSEIVGYVAGKWDPSMQHMSIMQAFPCRCRLGDKENAGATEEEIRHSMEQRGLTLLGWYHSHPKSQPYPSLRDIDTQMEHQIRLRGMGNTYLPCIGLILSPYDPMEMRKESAILAFWVMPPPENKPQDYGIPMKMEFDITQDVYLSQDLLNEMKWLVDYYKSAPDVINFSDNWHQGNSYLDKIKASLARKFPKDQTDGRFVEFIQNILSPLSISLSSSTS